MQKNKITKKQADELGGQISVLYEYMKMTEDVVKPIDEIACRAIENIVSLTMVSIGRKYGLDYCESEEAKIDNEKEKQLDDIMKDISEGIDE